MKKPNLSPDEWGDVEEYLSAYADGYNRTAEIMDSVMSELLNCGFTEGLIFDKPGEAYEGISYRLQEMQKEFNHR
ncbi:hypothetical protein [Levilactobacillus enshiensis]|uniref:hypothetical protein n=1 Tax=Levilactobacillus enshiensis TaxID=2590213 RepID=UPI00117B102C|nr:hypothetical protein [Levilactobacillus enshiensis]